MDLTNDLLCCENASPDLDSKCKAYLDPVLISDDRVLYNLLNLEEKYMPNSSYFKCVQTDVYPYMREETAHWMLQVCQEERREEEVFTLAMNMMDRFLSLVKISRQQLQLLGTVCLFLSSKIKESPPFDLQLLSQYTADSVTVEEIRKWELLVLSRLKWDLAAITPHAFLDQILARLHLKLHEAHLRLVREHATFFITACATDARFTSNPPSMVAAAAVASAVKGLLMSGEEAGDVGGATAMSPICSGLGGGGMGAGGYDMGATQSDPYHPGKQRGLPSAVHPFMHDLFRRLHTITQIDPDCLKECHRQIEIWTQSYAEVGSASASSTPTDLHEVII